MMLIYGTVHKPVELWEKRTKEDFCFQQRSMYSKKYVCLEAVIYEAQIHIYFVSFSKVREQN